MTILSVSKQSYAEEIKLDIDQLQLKIPLFDYEKVQSENGFVYCMDKKNLQSAWKVHATYQALGDLALLQDEQLLKLDRKYSSCDLELKACKYTLKEVDIDRNNVYTLYEDVVHINEVELKKQRIKFTIIGIGGGIVAIAVGFLVGYFVGK